MKTPSTRLLPVVAAALLASGSMLALADPAPILTLGETITLTGSADAAPTPCDISAAPAVSCANLRSAIDHANANAVANTYTRIILANGSTHTLDVADGGDTETAYAYDNTVGDLDITKPVVIETTDNAAAKATIAGGAGFNDRLLQINASAGLTNLVLSGGQGVEMNGGGIYADELAVTTLSRSVVTGNFASWDGDYGDPLVEGDGTNEVQGNGGGIYSKGPLTISYSTISNNDAYTVIGAAEYEKSGNGGAIYASQATTIVDSTIGGSTEPATDGSSVGTNFGNIAINGGGIQMSGGNKLEVLRSTFSFNYAVSGGAINVVSPSISPFTITNSTISDNHVTDSGAGINSNAGVYILNTTIANNRKDSGNKGSGINLVGGSATLKNSLLSNNTGSTGTVSANCGKTGSGTLAVLTQGGNLSTDATCNLTYSSDQQSVLVANVQLAALAVAPDSVNGTATHALQTGSVAIDAGLNDGCPSTDQRGKVRPLDGLTVVGTLVPVCDVGAYEFFLARPDLSITGISAVPDRQVVTYQSTVTISLSNGDATNPATAVELTTTLPSGVAYVSGSGATCNAVGAVVTCDVGDIAASGTADVVLVLDVSGAGSNELTVDATTTAADPFPDNNSATVTLTGLTVTDLNVTSTGTSFAAGGQGTVNYTVTNQGTAVAKNVVLSGSAPAGLSVVSTSDAGICSISGTVFTCTIPEILASGTRSIGITVSSGTVASYSLTASVSGDVVDGDAADNSTTATVSVVAAGGGGGGCAMASGESPIDPTLPLLAAAGLMALGLRRTRRN